MDQNDRIRRVNKASFQIKAATNDFEIVTHLLAILDNYNDSEVVGDELATNGFVSYLGQKLPVWQTTALLLKSEPSVHKVRYSYRILWNYSDCSAKFCKAIANAGINALLSDNLKNRHLVESMKPKTIEFDIMCSTLSTAYNMIRRRNHVYYRVSEADKKTLIEVAASNTHESDMAKLVCIILLSKTFSEKEMSQMGMMCIECIQYLLNNLNTALESETHRGEDLFSIQEMVDAVAGFGRFVDQRKALVDRGILNIFNVICESDGASTAEVESTLEAIKIFFRDNAIRDNMKNSFGIIHTLKRLLLHKSSSVRSLSQELLCVLEVMADTPGTLPIRHDNMYIGDASVNQQPLRTEFTLKSSKWREWSSSEVILWLKHRSFSPTLLSKPEIGQLDGALLEELVQMNHSSPDFFYDFMKNQLGITGTDLLKFSAAIRQLPPYEN